MRCRTGTAFRPAHSPGDNSAPAQRSASWAQCRREPRVRAPAVAGPVQLRPAGAARPSSAALSPLGASPARGALLWPPRPGRPPYERVPRRRVSPGPRSPGSAPTCTTPSTAARSRPKSRGRAMADCGGGPAP